MQKTISSEKVNIKIIKLLKNKIFIYPTDTIYGIGCDATNSKLIKKIRQIKQRDSKPFSVIAPNFKWIYQNCIVDEKLVKKYLPGKYTLILKKKNPNFLKEVSDNNFIGIRVPKSAFTKKIQKLNIPIVTTSVNLSGEKPITKISEIPKKILKKVNFIFEEGILNGNPSTIILNGKEIKR
ncbi:MAG: threonylcarbamoyl-AMP synthase [Nanoarchaeota archaeon]|nr:threonylcarbamoyl-AMP synthase [Nanoarchaeota archaeon]MBU4308400.1 threonylcarbamoyl-AMP synthase [Nanoarchaeota archaeon]